MRGGRRDANGPFLAEELTRRGLEPARITLVGDEPEELEAALREGLSADLLVVSGGLGPTHDDRTVELLARAAGLPTSVEPELAQEIEACLAADRRAPPAARTRSSRRESASRRRFPKAGG